MKELRMAKKKKATKKAGKSELSRAERSIINKAKHAREQAAREQERLRQKAATAAAEAAVKVTPYPAAGRKVTEFEEILDRQLAGGTAEPGETMKEPAAQDRKFDEKVIAQACQIPFDLWAISQNIEQLKLSDQEARMMGRPAKELLDHYLPQIPVIAWAWISFGLVGYGVMKPRLLIIQELKKKRSSSQPAAETRDPLQPQGGPPPPAPISTFPTIDQIKAEPS